MIPVVLALILTIGQDTVGQDARGQNPGAEALIWIDSRQLPLRGNLRWISLDAAFTPYFALNQHDRSGLSYVAEVDVVENDGVLPVGVPVEVSFPGLTQ